MTEKVFFTSDTHFFHSNILKFQAETGTRLGSTVEEMNQIIVDRWNEQVGKNDQVYILGDVSFGNVEKTDTLLKQLSGQKHLIYGNHDQMIKSNKKLQAHFVSVQDYKIARIGGKRVVLFHFPITVWDRAHYGEYHLFGHRHGRLVTDNRSMDVGIDAHPQKDMRLWSWEEIDAILSQRGFSRE